MKDERVRVWHLLEKKNDKTLKDYITRTNS